MQGALHRMYSKHMVYEVLRSELPRAWGPCMGSRGLAQIAL